jgi:hypothetical protein
LRGPRSFSSSPRGPERCSCPGGSPAGRRGRRFSGFRRFARLGASSSCQASRPCSTRLPGLRFKAWGRPHPYSRPADSIQRVLRECASMDASFETLESEPRAGRRGWVTPLAFTSLRSDSSDEICPFPSPMRRIPAVPWRGDPVNRILRAAMEAQGPRRPTSRAIGKRNGRLPRGCVDAPPTMESLWRCRSRLDRDGLESRPLRPLRRRRLLQSPDCESAPPRARHVLRRRAGALRPVAASHPYQDASTSGVSRACPRVTH